jgi:hypothetical protein
MLNVIVEACAVSLLLEVALDLALVGFDVSVGHLRESGIFLRLFPHGLLIEDGLVSVFVGDHGLHGLKVLGGGLRSARAFDFLPDGVGAALDSDRDLVKTTEDLELNVLIKHSEILRLVRQVDGVLGTRHKLTLSGDGTEVGNLGEVEVKR